MTPRTRIAAIAATVLAGLSAIATIPPAAQAAWSGTPGRVAFLDRSDPDLPLVVGTPRLGEVTFQTVRAKTAHGYGGGEPQTNGVPSPPAWSPDGTRLAFAAAVPDPGIGNGATHYAIFIWHLRTNTTTQVTNPPDGVLDNPNDGVETGFGATDMAPAWSPDGDTLAFVRLIAAGKDEPRYAQRGGDVFTVPTTGGAGTPLTDFPAEHLVTGLSWGGDPEGASRLVGIRAGGGGMEMLTIDPGSGTTASLGLSTVETASIFDFDVAPDGRRVEYVKADNQGVSLDIATQQRTLLGTLGGTGVLRAGPTNNGPLHIGLTTVPGHGRRAGLIERRRPDASGDVWPEDPLDRWVNGVLNVNMTDSTGMSYADRLPSRHTWDIQSQRLPIINIPGFAGSQIVCGAETLWAPTSPFGNGAKLTRMTLNADGRTGPCAGPTTDPDDPEGFVSEVFGMPIYAPQEEFIDTIAPGDRGWRFSWDWRKAPKESLERLDALITRALETDFARNQGLDRVVIYAHSYGGMLAREYLETRPERLSRVLTVGTPYLGVPKPIFFINFGVENPLSGAADLDSVLPNTEARLFARNAAGAYHLIAQDNAPRWLTLDGAFQDAAGVRRWFTEVGGANAALFDQARAWHAAHDGFDTAAGTVEWRAVIGTGELTIGGVEIPAAATAGMDAEVQIRMTNGDVTVPAVSAGQGPLGTRTPLGDPVHVQAVCDIGHMDLGGAPAVTEKYTEYLLTGRTPRRTGAPCTASGLEIQVVELGIPGAAAASITTADDEPAARLRAQGAIMDGRAHVLNLPGGPRVITNDRRPVDLQLSEPGRPVRLEIRHHTEDGPGGTAVYPSLDGDVRVTTGADGAAVVTLDGVPQTPRSAPAGTPPPGAAPPADGTDATPPPPPAAAPVAPRITAMRAIPGKVRRGKPVKLRISTSRPARVTLTLVRLRPSCRRAFARCRGTRLRGWTVATRRSPLLTPLRVPAGKLRPGRYRIDAVPRAGASIGARRSVVLTVLPR